MGKAILGGAIGAVIGAVIWGAIVYFAQMEIGWIALGVGFLTGLGVAAGSGSDEGIHYGVIAVLFAFLAILVGKFVGVYLMVDDDFKSIDTSSFVMNDENMLELYADQVAAEWDSQGKQTLIKGAMLKDGEAPPYTPALKKEAQKRWNARTPEQKQQEKDEYTAEAKAAIDGILRDAKDSSVTEAFLGSFSPLDFLFFGLAALIAFKTGSGMTSDD